MDLINPLVETDQHPLFLLLLTSALHLLLILAPVMLICF